MRKQAQRHVCLVCLYRILAKLAIAERTTVYLLHLIQVCLRSYRSTASEMKDVRYSLDASSLDASPFSTCPGQANSGAVANAWYVSYNDLAAGQQHTFLARVVDTQGNVDPTPASYICTPTQAVHQLINTIDSFHLPKGVTTSLEAPLNAALAQLNRNHDTPVCNQLNAFLNQVNAKQTNGQLTSQQAADLSQQAKAIQQSIGCSNVGWMLGQTSPSLLPLPMP